MVESVVFEATFAYKVLGSSEDVANTDDGLVEHEELSMFGTIDAMFGPTLQCI
jgi:hypothetical protein